MVTPPRKGLTRRAFLAAAAGAAVAGRGRSAFAAAGPRLAAIDWAMAETALMLGHAPVAMAELIADRRSAPLPPGDAVDLGLRGAPNLEALSLVAPDLILSSSYYTFAEPQLQRIAPVLSEALFVPGEPPFPKLEALVSTLGARIGDPAAAGAATTRASAELAAMATRAQAHSGAACLLIQIGDSRHTRIFGADSLFDGALTRLGLRNAWTEGTRFAFAAPEPMERLAGFPEARLVIVGEVPAQARRALTGGILWNSLPPVRAGRVHELGEMNGFGGLPSALHFATRLVQAMEAAG